jgi:hypothetical protein
MATADGRRNLAGRHFFSQLQEHEKKGFLGLWAHPRLQLFDFEKSQTNREIVHIGQIVHIVHIA